MINWNCVTTRNNLNEMWVFWKHLLASVIDKHAPFRTKRVKNKRSPWIANVLLREIQKRAFLKKKAASTNDPSIRKQFKDARNKASNSVKKAKRKYFSENFDANKSDSNLGKVNQPKRLKSKQETNFSPHLVILLKHLTIILQHRPICST